jgi:predicted transcriptional regulator
LKLVEVWCFRSYKIIYTRPRTHFFARLHFGEPQACHFPEPRLCFGLKTAISIPNDLFEGAERLARRTRRSRSRLFSDALREYLAHHTPDNITELTDKALAQIGAPRDSFISSTARRTLHQIDW